MLVHNLTLYVQNQMLELYSAPTTKGSQPLFGVEICETILGRRLDYLKDFGYGPKPKSHKSGNSSSSTYLQ